jgi:hypothetical protein
MGATTLQKDKTREDKTTTSIPQDKTSKVAYIIYMQTRVKVRVVRYDAMHQQDLLFFATLTTSTQHKSSLFQRLNDMKESDERFKKRENA